jgi:hypothetical protein
MTVGTKSVLFGAHCFFIHPWFVAWAWWKLNSFPWDPRLWIAFFVHDIGYLGKPNMDGPEGESHPYVGARIMQRLFDRDRFGMGDSARYKWYDFCLYHSRFLAKQNGAPVSRLCYADKLSFCLTPEWVYLPMVRLSGEIHEYMKLAKPSNEYSTMNIATSSQQVWYSDVKAYLGKWVEEHKDGRIDTWTPEQKQAQSDSGVWK